MHMHDSFAVAVLKEHDVVVGHLPYAFFQEQCFPSKPSL